MGIIAKITVIWFSETKASVKTIRIFNCPRRLVCVHSVMLRLLLGKQYNAGTAWGGSWKPRIYYYNSPYSLVCYMTLESFHVIDSWLLHRHYSKADVHQTPHHTTALVCNLHPSDPAAEAQVVPSWQRELGDQVHAALQLVSGEGNCSNARKGGSTAECPQLANMAQISCKHRVVPVCHWCNAPIRHYKFYQEVLAASISDR